MPDVLTAKTDLLAALRSLPGVGERVYDGQVPAKVPEYGGYIMPYIAVWSGLGSDLPEERDLTRLYDPGVLDWAPVTSCVGASADIAAAVARQVATKLTNLPLHGGWLMPDADAFRTTVPIADNQVVPARFYLPLPWRLTTTT